MSKELWIFAEQIDGIVASSFYEILSKAREIYANADEPPAFTAVVMDGDRGSAESLKDSGADKVISIVDEKLRIYDPAAYTSALCEAAQALKPETILVAASSIGAELAPSVAARLKTGLAAHFTELTVDDRGELHMFAPAFGGKLMCEFIIPNARPVMASIKPGVFDRTELEPLDAEIVDFKAETLRDFPTGITFVDRRVEEIKEMPIENAEMVICAGLGCAVSGNLGKAKELAKALGASMCYTRPLADLGYYPNENSMVGTSGKTIKPKFYLGFGVSGAGQHVCGMKDSGVIVNVNSDETAQSFDISNYKIVGDCGIILDELLEQVQN